MGYQHILNLYADQRILLFRECYALEKVHGTSASVSLRGDRVNLSPGGASAEAFRGCFDVPALEAALRATGHASLVIHGEAYGGKEQKQAWRYGPSLRFVAFDVRLGDEWLDVPTAEALCSRVGLEFVHYRRVPTDTDVLDAERYAPSEQARRNGVDGEQPREGVVLRPLVECVMGGERVIAKHKRDEERETATPRKVVDPATMQALADAEAIAVEWVTDTRLAHVIDHLRARGVVLGPRATGDVVAEMVDDVVRESLGEIVDSPQARKAIGTRAAKLFGAWCAAEKRRAKEVGHGD